MPKGFKGFQKGHPVYSIKSQFKKGHKQSLKIRKKISLTHKGFMNNWKGGKIKTSSGYIQIYMPSHPYSNKHKYIREHRLIMEEYLGRYLKPNERVHHINNVKTDNRIKNLLLLPNEAAHVALHNELRKKNK